MKYKEPKIIKDKKIKKETRRNFWKVFIVEGSLLLLTSILAVVSAFKLDGLVKAKKVYLPTTSLQDFLVYFLVATLFILIFVLYKKFKKFREIVFKAIFVVAVFWGGITVLSLFLPVFGAILIMGTLIVLWLEAPTILVHDILMILGLAGIASFFGLGLTPPIVIALLFIFSVYDFIAVYKTKHMVLIAKEMVESKVILGFIIPKDVKRFKNKLKEIKTTGNFVILGGGDVVFPILLAVSVVPTSVLKAFIVVLFSVIGSLFSYWLFVSQKEGKPEPIPALPPIAFFTIVGYFLTLLLP